MKMKDAFDLFWEWANKPLDSDLALSSDIYNPVMMLTEEQRKNRAIVNETVRTGRTPIIPAGSADKFDVPKAVE
jgi:hypothetical protein